MMIYPNGHRIYCHYGSPEWTRERGRKLVRDSETPGVCKAVVACMIEQAMEHFCQADKMEKKGRNKL
jgi:hypothetical protein